MCLCIRYAFHHPQVAGDRLIFFRQIYFCLSLTFYLQKQISFLKAVFMSSTPDLVRPLMPYEKDILADANQFRPLCDALQLMIDATDTRRKNRKAVGTVADARLKAISVLAVAQKNDAKVS